MRIDDLFNTIHEHLGHFGYTCECQALCQRISAYCDCKDIISVISERILPHFPTNQANGTDEGYLKLYCLSRSYFRSNCREEFSNLASRLNQKNGWRKTQHMGGYYYSMPLTDNCEATIWVTQNHTGYGFESYCPENIIFEFFNNSTPACMIISFNREKFLFIYNDVNYYTTVIPMRIIRSLFMREFAKNQYAYFHAAGIMYQGKGILLCGESGKGKTSTLLHLLNASSCSLIANDKMFIGIKGKEAICYGWPTVVTLGVGTMASYDQLRRFLTNIDDVTCSQDLYGYSPREDYLKLSDEQMHKLKRTGNKLVISHAHLSRLFNKKIVPSGKIDIVISVDLQWDCEETIFRKLNDQEKNELLDSCLTRNISDQLTWAGYSSVEVDVLPRETANAIIASADFYEYRSDLRHIDLLELLNGVI